MWLVLNGSLASIWQKSFCKYLFCRVHQKPRLYLKCCLYIHSFLIKKQVRKVRSPKKRMNEFVFLSWRLRNTWNSKNFTPLMNFVKIHRTQAMINKSTYVYGIRSIFIHLRHIVLCSLSACTNNKWKVLPF